MAGTQLDIEAIVREVLRRLARELPAAEGATTTAPTPSSQPRKLARRNGSATEKVEPGTIRVTDRVVTLAGLKERLSGVKKVVVTASAVVTPSVRDELRKRKIELQVDSNFGSATKKQKTKLLVAAASGSYDMEAVLKMISAEAGGCDRIGSCGVVELIRELAERIDSDGLPAVLLTEEPAVAVCLANRLPAIRAAWATDAMSVQQASKSIGANLLVLNPASLLQHSLKNMVRQFLQGSHDCPECWEECF